MKRVMLVEDHASFHQAKAFILGRQVGIEVVAQARTLGEDRRLLGQQDVDVAVVDFNASNGRGTGFVEHFRNINTQGVALLPTASVDPETCALGPEAGADELLHKSEAATGIVEAMGRSAVG